MFHAFDSVERSPVDLLWLFSKCHSCWCSKHSVGTACPNYMWKLLVWLLVNFDNYKSKIYWPCYPLVCRHHDVICFCSPSLLCNLNFALDLFDQASCKSARTHCLHKSKTQNLKPVLQKQLTVLSWIERHWCTSPIRQSQPQSKMWWQTWQHSHGRSWKVMEGHGRF